MTLAVVTDSAACLPPALADRRGIEAWSGEEFHAEKH